MKITVLDGYTLNPGDLTWEGFEKFGEVIVFDRTSPEEVFERSKDSEVLLTNKTVLNSKIISSLPKLKYIGVLATGYNVVDTEEAHKHGIIVTNIPSYSTMSVAQRVFALLLAVTDRAEHYALKNKEGAWSSSKDFCWWDTQLIELSGKYLGIIGLGNIGKAVAKIADAFQMKVLAHTSKKEEELPDYVEKVSLDNLFKKSDVISLHCPLTASTKEIINKDSLAKMKQGVILINTGRGPLVNESDIAEALNTGKIKAFCADVLSEEPPSMNNPLLKAPNTFITPHTAWATREARERLMKIAEDNLNSFLSGTLVNVV